jgi:hypothetical protein
MMTAEALKVYAFRVNDDGELAEPAHHEDPGAEVDLRVRRYMTDHPQIDYPHAFRVVLGLDEQLMRRYAGLPEPEPAPRKFTQAESLAAGREVDRLARGVVAERHCTYREAMNEVLRDNSGLREAYSAIPAGR